MALSCQASYAQLGFMHANYEQLINKLIDRAVKSIPDQERVKLYRRIHELIYEDQPYTFMMERDHILLAYNAKFKSVKPWYTYAVGEDYWWIDRPSL